MSLHSRRSLLVAVALSTGLCERHGVTHRCAGGLPWSQPTPAEELAELVRLRDLVLDPGLDPTAEWGDRATNMLETWGVVLEPGPPFRQVILEYPGNGLSGVQFVWLKDKSLKWSEVLAAFGSGTERGGGGPLATGASAKRFQFGAGTPAFPQAYVFLDVLLHADRAEVNHMIVRRSE